jgi:methionyl-tRNA synthetase
MTNKYYVTTPIYYVNDVPHIGHAYTSLAADVIARFMRLSGREVMLLTGTDEHGQKVEKSAIKNNVEPQIFTNNTSESFRKLMRLMNISNDDFIRTTETRHKEGVISFWNKLLENGHIYLGKYSGWYSLRDEAFFDESELTSDGLAPTGAAVEWIEEPSYFFDLSKWQNKLLEFYEQNPDFILPNSRKSEVINFVKAGLDDLSISRTSFNWGIKVPNDEKHVIYVWLDALANYITALGYPNQNGKYKEFWPVDVHILGKDILRFHAIYWPAFLMAANLPLPKCIMAHGWWTNEGEKISKSVGNVIDPLKLIDEFGLDQVRYFLMREINFGNDGNYSRNSLINKINSELANKIGNLMQRTLSFVYKNTDAKIPLVSTNFIQESYKLPLLKMATNSAIANIQLMEKFNINDVLNNIILIVEAANLYIDKEAPWKLKIDSVDRMNEVLYVLLESLRYISIMLQPFIPDSANKMLDQLGVDKNTRTFKHLNVNYALVSGSPIPEPSIIFPRIIIS